MNEFKVRAVYRKIIDKFGRGGHFSTSSKETRHVEEPLSLCARCRMPVPEEPKVPAAVQKKHSNGRSDQTAAPEIARARITGAR